MALEREVGKETRAASAGRRRTLADLQEGGGERCIIGRGHENSNIRCDDVGQGATVGRDHRPIVSERFNGYQGHCFRMARGENEGV